MRQKYATNFWPPPSHSSVRYDDSGGGCGSGGADMRRRSEAAAESEAKGGEGENFPLGEQRVPAAVGFVRGQKYLQLVMFWITFPK